MFVEALTGGFAPICHRPSCSVRSGYQIKKPKIGKVGGRFMTTYYCKSCALDEVQCKDFIVLQLPPGLARALAQSVSQAPAVAST